MSNFEINEFIVKVSPNKYSESPVSIEGPVVRIADPKEEETCDDSGTENQCPAKLLRFDFYKRVPGFGYWKKTDDSPYYRLVPSDASIEELKSSLQDELNTKIKTSHAEESTESNEKSQKRKFLSYENIETLYKLRAIYNLLSIISIIVIVAGAVLAIIFHNTKWVLMPVLAFVLIQGAWWGMQSLMEDNNIYL